MAIFSISVSDGNKKVKNKIEKIVFLFTFIGILLLLVSYQTVQF